MSYRNIGLMLFTILSLLVMFVGCGNEVEEDMGESIETEHKPPPVEYAVGKVDINDEAYEPSVHLKLAVAPGTPEKDIKRLFSYFEKDRYAEYDIIWVDVYFDIESAKSTEIKSDFLVASLRVNRPNFREETYNTGDISFDDDTLEVTMNTEELIFLGYKGRMFDSPKQARALLDLMEEKPGRAIYKVTWESPEKCELNYSVSQLLLVRTKHSVSRESWSDMSVSEIRAATRGMGFGGKNRHGNNYSFTRLQNETAEDTVDDNEGE